MDLSKLTVISLTENSDGSGVTATVQTPETTNELGIKRGGKRYNMALAKEHQLDEGVEFELDGDVNVVPPSSPSYMKDGVERKSLEWLELV